MKIIISLTVLVIVALTIGCDNDTDAEAVQPTKLLTLQRNIVLDSISNDDFITVTGDSCSSNLSVAVGGGCAVRSFEGGNPAPGKDSFLDQNLQAFSCIVENNSLDTSFNVIVTVQTICSDIN